MLGCRLTLLPATELPFLLASDGRATLACPVRNAHALPEAPLRYLQDKKDRFAVVWTVLESRLGTLKFFVL